MIKNFKDKHTQRFFVTGKSTRLPPNILKKAKRKLDYIDFATSLADLKMPPSNHLHALYGDRSGQYAISVNKQWRICFEFADGDAYNVEIVDYH